MFLSKKCSISTFIGLFALTKKNLKDILQRSLSESHSPGKFDMILAHLKHTRKSKYQLNNYHLNFICEICLTRQITNHSNLPGELNQLKLTKQNLYLHDITRKCNLEKTVTLALEWHAYSWLELEKSLQILFDGEVQGHRKQWGLF